jgi:Ca2+-binding RTX toxin-like protein
LSRVGAELEDAVSAIAKLRPNHDLTLASNPADAAGLTYTGSAGDDSQVGTGGDDLFNYGQGGDDTVFGGAGDDRINLGARFTTDDRINGGTGHDILSLNGDYYLHNQPILGPNTLFAVEEIRFGAGHDYVLTFDDANVAAGEVLTIDARKLSAEHFTSIHTLKETDGAFIYKGGAGLDALYLGQNNDTVFAGAGSDFAYVYPDYTGAGRYDGGPGTDFLSTLYSVSSTVTMTAVSVRNLESLYVNATVNAGDITIHLIMNDANVAAGQRMTLASGGTTGATTALYFDASAERDGAYEMYGNTKDDTFIGGTGDDSFKFFGGGTDWARGGQGDDLFDVRDGFDPTDRLEGGAGDDTLNLSNDYSGGLTFAATSLKSIEAFTFVPYYSYALTTDDANVVRNGVLKVDGSPILADHFLSFDGSDETNASFNVSGGAGDDLLTGGRMDDLMYGRSGADLLRGLRGGDRLSGGAGGDTFRYLNGADSRVADPDLITDFGVGADRIDLHQIDADTTTPGNQAFHFGKTAGHTGDIVAKYIAAQDLTEVRLYVNGDNTPDAMITLSGNHHVLSAGDYVL